MAGAIISLLAILLPPESLRIHVAFISVLIALVVTGIVSAKIGGANVFKATVRIVIGGAFVMKVTYTIGKMFGISGV